MNRVLVACIVFVVEGGISQVASAQEAESAREVVAKMAPRARQWRSDAVLTNLATFAAAENGIAQTWTAAFYSPTAKKWLAINASAGKLDVLEVSQGLTDPIGEFIDSGEAIGVAKKNGLTQTKDILMGLVWTGAKDGVACWTVGGGFEPGSVAVVIDAKTGDFITKQETP